ALALGHDRFRRSSRAAQLGGGAAAVGGVAVAAAVVGRRLERRLPAPLHPLALKPTFSLRPLVREGLGVAAALERDDLPAARRGLACWRADARRTASPNAGAPMAAMAGALGRRLEKVDAHVLGGGFPAPSATDVRRAAWLVEAASALAAGGVLAILAVVR